LSKIIATVLLSLALLSSGVFLSERSCRADYGFDAFRPRKGYFGLEFGLRYFDHYVHANTILTPPGGFFAEAQLSYWTKAAAFYFGYAAGKSNSNLMQLYSPGLKIPFVTFIRDSAKPALGGVQFLLIADGTFFAYPHPIPPSNYHATGWALRYGMGVNWGLNQSKAYLETSMMASQVQGNFFLAPIIGIGIRF
jgi:hypothetical protein